MTTQPTTEQADAAREAIGRVLGRIPSGIAILTAADVDGQETGMLASWVQQASFEPPMVSVAVNRKRFLIDWLGRSRRLALSLVAEDQKKLLGHFGRGFEPGQPAFEGLNIIRGTTGLPVLGDALGYLEGNIAGQIEAGDHIVFVVEIVAAGSNESQNEAPPWVHIRKNGFNY